MKYLVLALTFGLVACGDTGPQGETGSPGIQGEKGDKGEPGEVVVIDNTDPFVGEYYFPYSGFAIININHEDEHSVDVRIDTLNPDDTICSLDLDASTIDEHGDRIVYSGNLNLSSGNCRSDADRSLTTGGSTSFQHRVILSFNDDNELQARLMVFQIKSGKRTLVIDRTVTEE